MLPWGGSALGATSNPVFCAYLMVLGCGVGPGLLLIHSLEMGLCGRVEQAGGQIKGFNVLLCLSVPPVCEVCNFASPDAIAACSSHLYIHQHLVNDRFLFRIWAEEIVRCVHT